jgi:four helix bundle protein
MNQQINTNYPIIQLSNKKRFDIHDRIFNFVVDVIKRIRIIPKSFENQTIIDQLIRSSTSMGANDQEADGVSTKKDFIHCYTIVRKEAKETYYWIKLLKALNVSLEKEYIELLKENHEIICIVSAIIKNSNK